MLVPKYTVRRELSLNSQEFYNKQITDFLIAEHEKAVSSLVQALKAPPKMTKTEIREKNPKSKKHACGYCIRTSASAGYL